MSPSLAASSETGADTDEGGYVLPIIPGLPTSSYDIGLECICPLDGSGLTNPGLLSGGLINPEDSLLPISWDILLPSYCGRAGD